MAEKQVDKSAYDFDRYLYPERFASYYHQLREIMRTRPSSVLEIGVGDGFVASYMKRSPIQHTSLDIADDLGADYVGSVTDLPFPEKNFDTVYIFEVLEHLPYESLDLALRELARVAKKHVLISVPHFGPPVKFLLKLPFVPEMKLAYKIPYPQTHTFNGQHYWELGKRGHSPRRFRNDLNKYFVIERECIPFDSQYHHFFILTPR